MSVQIAGTTINKVCVVEDDRDARASYEGAIEDMGVEPMPETSLLQYSDVDDFLNNLQQSGTEAVLSDYHLRKHNYSRFDGDDIVEQCYRKNIPAVLCTTYGDWDITLLRSRRRFIPALLKATDLSLDSLAWGWERCIQEFQNNFQPSREASRTLVRVEDVSFPDGIFHVVVPGWNPREKIRVLFDDLPVELRSLVEPEKRFHAKANVGCESGRDLYFFDWEAK